MKDTDPRLIEHSTRRTSEFENRSILWSTDLKRCENGWTDEYLVNSRRWQFDVCRLLCGFAQFVKTDGMRASTFNKTFASLFFHPYWKWWIHGTGKPFMRCDGVHETKIAGSGFIPFISSFALAILCLTRDRKHSFTSSVGTCFTYGYCTGYFVCHVGEAMKILQCDTFNWTLQK